MKTTLYKYFGPVLKKQDVLILITICPSFDIFIVQLSVCGWLGLTGTKVLCSIDPAIGDDAPVFAPTFCQLNGAWRKKFH